MGKLGKIKFAPARWIIGFIGVVIAVAIVISAVVALLWAIGYGLYEITGFDWLTYSDGEAFSLGISGMCTIVAIAAFWLLCYGGKQAGDWLFNSIKNNKEAKKAEEDKEVEETN